MGSSIQWIFRSVGGFLVFANGDLRNLGDPIWFFLGVYSYVFVFYMDVGFSGCGSVVVVVEFGSWVVLLIGSKLTGVIVSTLLSSRFSNHFYPSTTSCV